ncbi:MAG: hydroxyethylthiazole kinase [Terriglobia bacterium]|jgi:hydroxyethylthiazole kinase|nr:hydroxyethylthiazole kinase [Terriglobia bacterium]
MPTPAQSAADLLTRLRQRRPLIHHITNFVVMNETANITLCAGGAPVMAHAKEEVAEMVAAAGALVLNIGTLTPEQVESMLIAGRRANELDIPIVLDPVGAGATQLRTESARRLLSDLKISIIRGNLAELATLVGFEAKIAGVDSHETGTDPETVARTLAQKNHCVAAITGAVDIVSNGARFARISNGHPMMGRVTGTGCMSTSITACFAAIEADCFLAATAALAVFGLAGEIAVRNSKGPGTFHAQLYDALANLTPEALAEGARIEIVE